MAHHWHRFRILLSWSASRPWVDLYPPVSYETARATVQAELDSAAYSDYSSTDRQHAAIATAWRRGTEYPPNTVISSRDILVMFGCDNECRANAQAVFDEWAVHLKMSSQPLNQDQLREDWPADYRQLFPDSPDPTPRRSRKRRR